MNARAEDLLRKALELDPEERAELAGQILHTLDPEDPGVEEAWRSEIQKRIAELDSGTVKAVSAEEARKRIFRLPHDADSDL